MNIITATFKPGSKSVSVSSLYQWDYGQMLKLEGIDLPESYEVHFSNTPECGQAEVRIGTEDGVSIPDTLMESGEPVYAYVFLHADDDDGETVYVVTIQVKKRPKPFYSTPTSVQQSLITEAIAALTAGVNKANAAADSAEVSAGTATAAAEEAAAYKADSELAASAAADYRDSAYGYTQEAERLAGMAGQSAENADLSAQAASAAEGNAHLSAQAAAQSASAAEGFAADAAASRDGIENTINAALAEAKASGEFNGDKGDPGAIFTPNVSAAGVISWTNNGNLTNPDPVDIVAAVCNALPLAEEASF